VSDSPEYLGREDLVALGIELELVDCLLRATPLSGDDGRPVVEADRLRDLLAMLEPEGRSS
jgi:hypothetical protein